MIVKCSDCDSEQPLLNDRIIELELALAPFITANAGLHFDTIGEKVIVKCRYCFAWAGDHTEFQHDSDCIVERGRTASDIMCTHRRDTRRT